MYAVIKSEKIIKPMYLKIGPFLILKIKLEFLRNMLSYLNNLFKLCIVFNTAAINKAVGYTVK
jgi:hypothetical protein